LVLSDAQIEKVFTTKIGVPENASFRWCGTGLATNFWSEEFAKLDQQSMGRVFEKTRA